MILQLLASAAPRPNWASICEAFAAMTTAVTALVAAFIALRQQAGNRSDAQLARELSQSQTKQTRAHEYLKRYDEPRSVQARTRLHDFFMVDESKQNERITAWLAMPYKETVTTVQGFNFWEELAGMYNRDLVDPEIVASYFGTEALTVWDRTAWFIRYVQAMDARNLAEFEAMCKNIRRIHRGAP